MWHWEKQDKENAQLHLRHKVQLPSMWLEKALDMDRRNVWLKEKSVPLYLAFSSSSKPLQTTLLNLDMCSPPNIDFLFKGLVWES